MKIKVLRAVSFFAVFCVMFSCVMSVPASAETASEYDENEVTEEIKPLKSTCADGILKLEKDDIMCFEILDYDDGEEYVFGETPFELFISDETIACVSDVNGCMIGVKGISKGNTVLNVKSPDGRTLDIEIEVYAPYSDDHIQKPDYAPTLEYDRSPMRVGEIRKVSVYNPGTGKTGKLEIDVSQKENCLIEYEEGDDGFFIKAIHEGKINICVFESTCPFDGYMELDVRSEEAMTHPTININYDRPGDLNEDSKVNVADLVKLQQLLNKKAAYTAIADINKDGTVNVFDMILLKRIILSGR